MRALGRYAFTGLLAVAVVTIALWWFLDDAGRRGILAAAGIAYPVQVAVFALLLRARTEPSRFLIWWAAGVLARIGVVIAVGIVASRLESIQPAALLLGLVGFFFGLLLMEPAFFKAPSKDMRATQ